MRILKFRLALNKKQNEIRNKEAKTYIEIKEKVKWF